MAARNELMLARVPLRVSAVEVPPTVTPTSPAPMALSVPEPTAKVTTPGAELTSLSTSLKVIGPSAVGVSSVIGNDATALMVGESLTAVMVMSRVTAVDWALLPSVTMNSTVRGWLSGLFEELL